MGSVVRKIDIFHIAQKLLTILHSLFSHSRSLVLIAEILFHLVHFATI